MLMKRFARVFVVLLSALGLIGVQGALMEEWRAIYEERERQAKIKQEILRLERLVADVDNGFRGYVLVNQSVFLGPMVSAEGAIPGVVERLSHLTDGWPELQGRIHVLRDRITGLLDAKRRLTMELENGREDVVLAYIRGGEGVAMAKTLALAFQDFDQRLEKRQKDVQMGQKIEWVRWGLSLTAVVGFIWGIGVGRTISLKPHRTMGSTAFETQQPHVVHPHRIERDFV